MGIQARLYEQTRAATSLKVKGRLAPELMQSLQVLVMSASELEAFVFDAAERNPLLEIDFNSELFGFEPMPSERAFEGSANSFTDDCPESFEAFDSNEHNRTSIASSVDWDFSRIKDDYAETETLQAYLHLQASGLSLSRDEFAIMEALIESISSDGYFDSSSDQIAFELGVERRQVDSLLAELQSFRPKGVAATTLADCLLAQVEKTEPHYDLIVDIIRNQLDDFMNVGDLFRSAHERGTPEEDLAQAIAVITSLNPRPGAEFYQRPDYRYAIPDIVIREENGSFEASVLGADRPCLVLSKVYSDMMLDGKLPEGAIAYLEGCYSEADRILRTLDLRNGMLQRLASSLLKRQIRFFATGGKILAPMTMQDVADDLGVHVSTISRAINEKYLQVPWACIPLKSMFSNALDKTNSEGGMDKVSSADVKSMIASIIRDEPRDNPFSDQKICEILNARGVTIKRRTVAKYRIALGFDSRLGRKQASKIGTGGYAHAG